MKSIVITYKKVPLIVHYTASKTDRQTDPVNVDIEKIVVRGSIHDIFGMLGASCIAEIEDKVISAELEEGFQQYELEADDPT